MSVPYEDVVRWIRAYAQTIAENKTYLTELDSAIGDADHGVNMDRGMQAAVAKLSAATSGDVARSHRRPRCRARGKHRQDTGDRSARLLHCRTRSAREIIGK